MLREENNHIEPVGDRVLVRKDGKEEYRTAFGIIIPDSAQKRRGDAERGTIVAIGCEVPFELIEGDRIVFGTYSGTKIGDEEEGLLILRFGDIIGIER